MTAWSELDRPSPILRRYKLGQWQVWFICPGCEEAHAFDDRWEFNGDYEKPTFSPSLLVTWNEPDGEHRCHSFVRDGRIEFQSDCSHKLAGFTAPIPEWSDDLASGRDRPGAPPAEDNQ